MANMDALSILALGLAQSSGGGGTSDYSDLSNKPQINDVTLSGNKSLSDLGIPTYTAGDNVTISNNEISVEGLELEEDSQLVQDTVNKTDISGGNVSVSSETNDIRTKSVSLIGESAAINGEDQSNYKMWGVSADGLWFDEFNLYDRTVTIAPNDNYTGIKVRGKNVATTDDIPNYVAGDNVSITEDSEGNNVINATDTTYSAGTGIDITSDVISIDNTVALKSDIPAAELPTITGNANKVLKVNSGATAVEWANEATELPAIAAGDAGKVLTVNSGETGVEWAAGGGGGGSYTFTNGLTESSGTVSWDYNDLFKTTMSQTNPQGKYISIGKKAHGNDAPTSAGTYSVSLGNISEDSGYAKCSGRGAICAGDGSLNATGNGSIAMGFGQALRSIYSEGVGSIAMGYGNATESLYSSGQGSVAMGFNVKAHSKGQCAIGKNNIADNNDTYALIVGNGTSNSARSNALTVDWNGNLVCNNIPAPPAGDGTYNLQCTISSGVATYTWVAQV